MSAAQPSFESADLERLNDKDKAELRQFLANEQQRSQIQARKSCAPQGQVQPSQLTVCANVILFFI